MIDLEQQKRHLKKYKLIVMDEMLKVCLCDNELDTKRALKRYRDEGVRSTSRIDIKMATVEAFLALKDLSYEELVTLAKKNS